jgi:hypothetical protein
MKRALRRLCAAGILVVACACTNGPTKSASHEAAAPSSLEPDGSSIERAVPVPESNMLDGANYKNQWLFNHYQQFQKIRSGLHSHGDGRYYDIVTIKLPDGSEKTLYFEISAYYHP